MVSLTAIWWSLKTRFQNSTICLFSLFISRLQCYFMKLICELQFICTFRFVGTTNHSWPSAWFLALPSQFYLSCEVLQNVLFVILLPMIICWNWQNAVLTNCFCIWLYQEIFYILWVKDQHSRIFLLSYRGVSCFLFFVYVL